jgi:hypothetical protein
MALAGKAAGCCGQSKIISKEAKLQPARPFHILWQDTYSSNGKKVERTLEL